jgi:hypothetical protein
MDFDVWRYELRGEALTAPSLSVFQMDLTFRSF